MNEFKKQDQGKTEDKSAFGQLDEKGKQQQQGEFGKDKPTELEGAEGTKEFGKQQQQDQGQTRDQQGDRNPSDKGGQQG